MSIDAFSCLGTARGARPHSHACSRHAVARPLARNLTRPWTRSLTGAGARPASRFGPAAVALCLAGLLGACGGDKPVPTQLAARANGSEISVHQVNQALADSGTAARARPARLPALRREVLDRLIDQQLAVDEALAAKLDRRPEVMQEIEASRREILARSYYRQLLANQAEPTGADARRYYAEHPQLFAQRRIYRLRELIVPERSVGVDNLRVAAAARDLGALQDWLRGQNIPFSTSNGTRSAEQMPFEVLKQLALFRDGQTGIIETPDSLLVVQLQSSQAAPVDEAGALPVILRYLRNRQALETMSADTARLRARGKIEYLNEFALAHATPAAGRSAPASAAGDPTDPADPAGAAGASAANGATTGADATTDPAAAVNEAVAPAASPTLPTITHGALRLK